MKSIALWILAFVCVLAAASWQRRSGPSYPLEGRLELGNGDFVEYELVRTGKSDRDAIVELPSHASLLSASLHFRRHRTEDEFTVVEMSKSGEGWSAPLPKQPAAGKLDYYLVATAVGVESRAPANPAAFAVIRFKDPVPIFVLVPHILMMFVSMFCGLRAGFAALFEPGRGRGLGWVTLSCLTVGGLILGPVVQKFAFGAYWTGWPVGEDLTDTKTLLAWAGWAVAVLVAGWRGPVPGRARIAMGIATVLMLVVYLVPHSLRGSTLDYEAIDRGVSAEEAVRTG